MNHLGEILQVKAIRTYLSENFDTNRDTARREEVTIGIVVKEENKLASLEICGGGVTGYESFFINSRSLQRSAFVDWTACMGTPGRWDRLVVPWSSMKQVFDHFELWGMMTDGQGRELLVKDGE
jgi:hypothetical protein